MYLKIKKEMLNVKILAMIIQNATEIKSDLEIEYESHYIMCIYL